MKKILIMLMLIFSTSLVACTMESEFNFSGRENKNEINSSNIGIESSSENVNDKNNEDTNEDKNVNNIELLRNSFEKSFDNLKNFQIEELREAFCESDKKVYDQIVVPMTKQIPENFLGTAKDFFNKFKYEIEDIVIEDDVNALIKIKIKLFDRNFFTSIIPKYIKNEISIGVHFIKEDEEFKINELKKLVESISANFKDEQSN